MTSHALDGLAFRYVYLLRKIRFLLLLAAGGRSSERLTDDMKVSLYIENSSPSIMQQRLHGCPLAHRARVKSLARYVRDSS